MTDRRCAGRFARAKLCKKIGGFGETIGQGQKRSVTKTLKDFTVEGLPAGLSRDS
jgi:hypothetical protein